MFAVIVRWNHAARQKLDTVVMIKGTLATLVNIQISFFFKANREKLVY